MIVHVDRVRELLCFTQTINEEDGVVGVDLPLSSTPDSRLGSKQPAEAKHFIVDPATKDMNIYSIFNQVVSIMIYRLC